MTFRKKPSYLYTAVTPAMAQALAPKGVVGGRTRRSVSVAAATAPSTSTYEDAFVR